MGTRRRVGLVESFRVAGNSVLDGDFFRGGIESFLTWVTLGVWWRLFGVPSKLDGKKPPPGTWQGSETSVPLTGWH